MRKTRVNCSLSVLLQKKQRKSRRVEASGFFLKVRGVEHNMPKIWYYGVFSLFHRCRASARLPSQKQKSIRTLCIFGAEQFKTSRFLLEQGTKSPPYCRMARFLTQFRRKYAVLNHIGFDSLHLKNWNGFCRVGHCLASRRRTYFSDRCLFV